MLQERTSRERRRPRRQCVKSRQGRRRSQRVTARGGASFVRRSRERIAFQCSPWEIAIKQGFGRNDFHVDARVLRRSLFDNGYAVLPITSEYAVAIDSLSRSIEMRSIAC